MRVRLWQPFLNCLWYVSASAADAVDSARLVTLPDEEGEVTAWLSVEDLFERAQAFGERDGRESQSERAAQEEGAGLKAAQEEGGWGLGAGAG